MSRSQSVGVEVCLRMWMENAGLVTRQYCVLACWIREAENAMAGLRFDIDQNSGNGSKEKGKELTLGSWKARRQWQHSREA